MFTYAQSAAKYLSGNVGARTQAASHFCGVSLPQTEARSRNLLVHGDCFATRTAKRPSECALQALACSGSGGPVLAQCVQCAMIVVSVCFCCYFFVVFFSFIYCVVCLLVYVCSVPLSETVGPPRTPFSDSRATAGARHHGRQATWRRRGVRFRHAAIKSCRGDGA